MFEQAFKNIDGSQGVSHNVGINIEDLRLLPVSIPVVPAQSRIVSRLQDLQREAERLQSIYQRKLDALGELKTSLLHRAFSGELTGCSSDGDIIPFPSNAPSEPEVSSVAAR